VNEASQERVREVLQRVVEAYELRCEIVVEEASEGLDARVEGEDAAVLIGHHGQILDAIQHLAYRIAFRGGEERRRVSVDAGGYRERRAGSLRTAADQAAASAVGEGRPVVLEAMSATERRVVHEHLKTRGDVETYSQGQEPDRRLVVAPLGL
jgi:spoIIIJ-associated protein